MLAIGIQALAGCREVTGLALPVDAVAMDAVPAIYRTWWSEVEACSRRRRFFSWVRWYHVPNVDYFYYDDVAVDGYWLSHPDRIVLAGAHELDALVVRHEMLHAMIQDGEHPAEFFDRRCEGLVRRVRERGSLHG